MKLDPFNKKDPLADAAESVLIDENVEKIKKKVAQLKVGDKTNYGTVKEIGPDSITFKALHTPKTEIAFRQRKIGRPDYILMNLVKLTPDGKKVDKSFKEANDFTGAAAAAKVAGEDEFELNGKTYPVEIDLEVAKKIMSQSLKLAKKLSKDMDEDVDFIESNEFVGAAAAAKVAGEDEFEFNGKTYPVEISQETAEKIMSQALDLAKDLAKAKKEESTELEERVGSLQNSLKVLSKAGIGKGIARPGRVTDMPKLAKAIHKNYKAITGEKYEDADQVAMSEIIADLIGHFRIDGDEFITAWDSTIREETEISEATEFVKGDRVMDVRTRVKGTVLHKGNKDEVYVDLGAIKKAISSKDLRLVESTELEESKSSTGYELYHRDFTSAMAHAYEFAKKKYRIEVDPEEIADKVALGPKRPSKGKTNRYRLLDKDGKKAIHVQVYGMDSGKYELNMYKESKEELEEEFVVKYSATKRGPIQSMSFNLLPDAKKFLADKEKEGYKGIISKNGKPVKEDLEEVTNLEEENHDEWFTVETYVKANGQLYSTFYVRAGDMGQAKKKADKVFIELMKTTYPKEWPSYQKKFTLKVMKGDNIGELMP